MQVKLPRASKDLLQPDVRAQPSCPNVRTSTFGHLHTVMASTVYRSLSWTLGIRTVIGKIYYQNLAFIEQNHFIELTIYEVLVKAQQI